MGSLDTDDKVALAFTIPIIVLGCILAIIALTISTKYLKPLTKRKLNLKSENEKVIDGKVYNRSVLNVLIGDANYEQYLSYLVETNNGKLPTTDKIQDIAAPEKIFLHNYISNQNKQ